jgi:hypothetical protein
MEEEERRGGGGGGGGGVQGLKPGAFKAMGQLDSTCTSPASYVGFCVKPAQYPTDVLKTPGTRQNIFSVPQKQPVAKTHVSRLSGKGSLMGLFSTKWLFSKP